MQGIRLASRIMIKEVKAGRVLRVVARDRTITIRKNRNAAKNATTRGSRRVSL
jgi:hypothetical protein